MRRFGVLLRGLPASSRVWTEQNGGWTVTDHLLADLWEAVQTLRQTVWATVSTPPKQKPKIDRVAYPRPGVKTKQKRSFSWGGLARSLTRGGE